MDVTVCFTSFLHILLSNANYSGARLFTLSFAFSMKTSNDSGKEWVGKEEGMTQNQNKYLWNEWLCALKSFICISRWQGCADMYVVWLWLWHTVPEPLRQIRSPILCSDLILPSFETAVRFGSVSVLSALSMSFHWAVSAFISFQCLPQAQALCLLAAWQSWLLCRCVHEAVNQLHCDK